MQDKVFRFVETIAGASGILKPKKKKPKVLDIGSYDVNGSLKPLFTYCDRCEYIGVDMREGPNVDIVCNSHNLEFPANHFDLVTCVEMLEHDSNPFRTLAEIHRVLKPGGLTILAASGINFPKHDYPSDYFRFTGEGIKVLLEQSGFREIHGHDDENEAYGFGSK